MADLTVEEWVRERLDNCQRLAAQKTGADRDGWLEDAQYFSEILTRLDTSVFPTTDAAQAETLED